MIGRPDPLSAVAKAIAALDFAAENVELERLIAKHGDLAGKREATRDEIRSLTDRIANYRGPDPAQVAAAIMAGQSPAEAAAAGVSRIELEERRDALAASLDPIRERVDRLAAEIEAHKAAMRARIAEAVEPYAQHLRCKQVEAAEALLAAEASLIAVCRVADRYADPDGAAERARAGVTGQGSLLGWRDSLEVPSDVLAALKPLADKCGAVHSLPTVIPLR